MEKKRILYVDVLKLFTIYLVLWGHAIMHFQPDNQSSIIFQTIYSFHMPLFMMLSGYFATSSMPLNAKEFFPKKFRQLLLPCISWGVVCWLVITSGLIQGIFHLDIKSLFTAGWLGLIDNFWFLKSCFICYTLSWFCFRCGKYKLIAMGIVWFLCTMQGRFFLSTMFPSFLMGMMLRKNTQTDMWLTRKWPVVLCFFIALLSLKLMYEISDIYPFKLILGLTGPVACMYLFKATVGLLETTPILEKLAQMGRETLGIYVIQAIVLEVLMPRYISFSDLSLPTVVLLMPVLSLVVLIVCYVVIQIVNRSKFLGLLMFGRDYKK